MKSFLIGACQFLPTLVLNTQQAAPEPLVPGSSVLAPLVMELWIQKEELECVMDHRRGWGCDVWEGGAGGR